MNEADLRLHLAGQTSRSIGLVSVLDLNEDRPELERRYRKQAGKDMVLFDVLTEEHLEKIGGLLARESEEHPLFVIGSSGVEYALAAHWRGAGRCRPWLRSRRRSRLAVCW
ncbi:hypothetical protein LJK88_17370 [Paenibacillus sp. P26]|nr:hypothetical protein LJK88_17370 [Paenibacillus sp. P26]